MSTLDQINALMEANRRGLDTGFSPKQIEAWGELAKRKGNKLDAFVEPAITVGRGMAGMAVGGLLGLTALPFGVDKSVGVINRVQDAWAYKPKTEAGNKGLQSMGAGVQTIGDYFNQKLGQAAASPMGLVASTAMGKTSLGADIEEKGTGQSLGDRTLEATGSPILATAASLAPDIAEAMVGLSGAKALTKGMKQYEIGDLGKGSKQRGAVAGIEEKDLYKVHNITEGGLSKADELGGIPVPSLAIARNETGFDSFGNISLVGEKGSFAKDPTFGADVYSPRFPKVGYKVDRGSIQSEEKRITEMLDDRLTRSMSSDFNPERIMDDPTYLEYSLPNKAAYLEEIGEGVKPNDFVEQVSAERVMPEYFNDYVEGNKRAMRGIKWTDEFKQDAERWFDEIAGKHGRDKSAWDDTGFFNESGEITDEGIKHVKRLVHKDEQAFKYGSGGKFNELAMRNTIDDKIQANRAGYNEYLKSQRERLIADKKFEKWNPNTATTKRLEYNLQNAVKLMKGNIRGGEGFNYGAGNVRAMVAPQLKSMKQITDRRGKIVGSEEMPFIKEEFASRFENLEADLRDKMAYPGERIEDALLEYAKGDKSSFKGLTPDDSAEINSLLKDLAEAPTEYFEIKPQRAVDISEFYGAAVPEGTSADVIKQLESKGLVVETYTGEGRKEAISRLNKRSGGNIFFSGGGVAILYGQMDGGE